MCDPNDTALLISSFREVIQHMTVHQQNSKGESSNTTFRPIAPKIIVASSSQSSTSSHAASNKPEPAQSIVQVKKEVETDQV